MPRRTVRWLLSMVTVVLLSIVVVGCGDGETSTDTTEPTDAPAAADTQPITGTQPQQPTPANAAPEDDNTGPAEQPMAEDEQLMFGMIMVGPYNDAGWSQAHYEGARYAEERVPNTKFIYVDKVNPADRPNTTVEQIVEELTYQGARVIIANSDDFKDGTRRAARMHPQEVFVHISGDDVLTGEAPPNLGNVMGKMIYGKMIAGCAAALQSNTGNLSYLGPLVNDETRRLVNAAYLGAEYCANNLRDEPFADGISFEVVWIGFWFNIPGTTLDPTQVSKDFLNGGSDVIISGIDTTEALVEAKKAHDAGQDVYAIPYDFKGACEQGPELCLGVPYFNWGPTYVELLTEVRNGTWEPSWEWLDPNWDNINDPDTSAIGFVKGPALSEENSQKLDTFIAGLGDGSIQLFVGPLNYQDGTPFLVEGETATEEQIWYMEQLLEGIQGQSAEQ